MFYIGVKEQLLRLSSAVICFLMISNTSGKTIYVSPSGSSSGDGYSFSTGYDIINGISNASPGDTVLLQGGRYTIPYNSSSKNTITISVSGQSGKNITIMGENNKVADIDFSYPDNSKVLNSSITSIGLEVTGSYLYFKNIAVTRAGYQGAYASGKYITFENCTFYKNWNSGIEINKGGSFVTLKNCDAYGNYDSKYKNGGMADGFAIKQTMGPGNKVIGCRAWENSDDGYDTYDSPEFVLFENCWAIRNGFDQGNGNGFKVGGSPDKNVGQKNILKNCIAIGNKVKGFDQNNNTAGVTVYNCTSYKNGTNYGFGGPVSEGQHIFKNCISLSGESSDIFGNALQANNSWNAGFSANVSDFESFDTSLATVKRNPDGSLPQTSLLYLKSTSPLINSGVDVGIAFNGVKPDLGAFEFGQAVSIKTTGKNRPYNFSQTLKDQTLKICFNSNVRNAIVSLYSLDGTLTGASKIVHGREAKVNCSSLRTGLYITEIKINGARYYVKFTL